MTVPVTEHSHEFAAIKFDVSDCDLSRVVKVLKTVSNNLFHGGKHGASGWDNPDRTKCLLTLATQVLDELSNLGCLEGDYLGEY